MATGHDGSNSPLLRRMVDPTGLRRAIRTSIGGVESEEMEEVEIEAEVEAKAVMDGSTELGQEAG